MRKFIILLALIATYSLSQAQSWTNVGNSLQRKIVGSDTTYRFNLGAPGFWNISQQINAQGVISFNTRQGAVTLTSGDVTTALGFTPVTNARTLTINGTTSDLSANRTWSVGTVTSVAALTLGTSGSDLSSSVATGTTTPVITLNVPTASASNRGALSAADWTTFNNKQAAYAGLQDSITKKANRTFDNVASGAIANVKLANSSVTIGSTAISLGATSTTLAGLTALTSGNITSTGDALLSGLRVSANAPASGEGGIRYENTLISIYGRSGGFAIKNTAGTVNNFIMTDAGAATYAVSVTSPSFIGALTGNSTTATALASARTIGTLTGDVTSAGSSFDGTGNNTNATTLATVNSNVGSFGSATQVGTFTVNGKGLITAASNTTITPAVGSITGLGTGVATALAVNVGSAGAFVVNGGALGTPSSGTVTNLTGTASININGTVGATTPTTGVFTTAKVWDGIDAGFFIRPYTAGGAIGAIYPASVTPNDTNFTLIGSNGLAQLNSATNVNLSIANVNKLAITSSASTFSTNVALGSNDLGLTGSIGATGARVTKGWFTDLEVTNAIAGSVTGSAATLTTTRTIWGQNFNGSANVSGALSGATTGDFSGLLTVSANNSIFGTGGSSGQGLIVKSASGGGVLALRGRDNPGVDDNFTSFFKFDGTTLQGRIYARSNIISIQDATGTDVITVQAGATALSGALTGTSATFSAANAAVSISNASGSWYNATRGAVTVNLGVDATSPFINSSGAFNIYTNSGTTALTISSAQQAAFTSSVNGDVGVSIVNSHATQAYGLKVQLSGATYNDNTHYIYNGKDGSTDRFIVYSNGGISNYSANNVNLSDERSKKNFTPISSTWNAIKNIPIGNYLYNEEKSTAKKHLGTTAQGVEAVMPQWVNDKAFKAPDGSWYKGVYETQMFYGAIKALQEAMNRIELLEAKVEILEKK